MSSEYDSLEFEPPKYNKELWAMSLADLFSIVLSIFVLLFSLSAVNQAKTAKAVDGLQGKFATPTITVTQDTVNNPDLKPSRLSASGNQISLRNYYAKIGKIAKETLALEESQVINRGNVMVLRLPASLLFVENAATLDDKKQFMKTLADQLTTSALSENIDVEFLIGYQDRASKLSINRAGAFARSMVDLGVRESTLYVGVQDAEPDFITITFSPRDDTQSLRVF